MAKELILVRHATIGPKYRGCFIGSTDVELSEEGRRQTSMLARVLGAKTPARCLCSPMKRSLETARLVMADSVVPVETDEDLREVDFGRWEGKTFQEIEKADGDLVKAWASFELDFAFPEGEKVAEFLQRVERVAQRIEADAGPSVLVFTHGGVIRALICRLLGLAPRQYVLFDAKPASITTIELFGDKGVLVGVNDRCHLQVDS